MEFSNRNCQIKGQYVYLGILEAVICLDTEHSLAHVNKREPVNYEKHSC